MKTLLKILTLAAVCVAFTACNTVKGVGQDITTAAEKTEDVID